MQGFNSSVVHLDLSKSPDNRSHGWYLTLMAPNERGPSFAWLDPSRLYCHQQALKDCVEDLLQPFKHDQIDLVAGIDSMGFILGAAIASHLEKGFLAIRKAGHLCVETDSQTYVDYSGMKKVMEVRTDVIKKAPRASQQLSDPKTSFSQCDGGVVESSKDGILDPGRRKDPIEGLRILLVDQWIETGGTMQAAIKLVEKQGGIVAGVAAICIEDSAGGKWVRESYKCSDCVPEQIRSQFNNHFLESFKAFCRKQNNINGK